MSRKKKLRVVLTNLLLFSPLFGLVSLNKEILRPAFSNMPILKPVLGSFPNFIAAYIISLFFVNGALTIGPRQSRLLAYLGSFAVCVVLTVEELRPMWGASTQYDALDIVASGVGALFAVSTYEVAVVTRKRPSIRAGTEPEPNPGKGGNGPNQAPQPTRTQVR